MRRINCNEAKPTVSKEIHIFFLFRKGKRRIIGSAGTYSIQGLLNWLLLAWYYPRNGGFKGPINLISTILRLLIIVSMHADKHVTTSSDIQNPIVAGASLRIKEKKKRNYKWFH